MSDAAGPAPLEIQPPTPTAARTHWLLNPYVLVVLGALLDAGGELLMKKGAIAVPVDAHGPFGFAALASIWTWLGITCKILGLLAWLQVLRFVPLSVAFPLNNVVTVLVPIGAQVFLHEHVSLGRWVGIGLVVCGALLIVKPLVHAEEKL